MPSDGRKGPTVRPGLSLAPRRWRTQSRLQDPEQGGQPRVSRGSGRRERLSPGPLQEGLCNLPGAGSRAGAPQEVEPPGLPCAAPPATCHPATRFHLPPSDVLAGNVL